MEIERNKHETLLFSTGFNYWLCTLPNRNTSIRLRVEYSILFRWSIRFQSNLDEIIQTRVYIRSIFNFDFFLASFIFFLSWNHIFLAPFVPWIMDNSIYVYISIHLPFPLGNLVIHPKHFLYFPFLTQFHETHGERVDVKWNTRNPLMQEVGYDSQLKHYRYNFNLLL